VNGLCFVPSPVAERYAPGKRDQHEDLARESNMEGPAGWKKKGPDEQEARAASLRFRGAVTGEQRK